MAQLGLLALSLTAACGSSTKGEPANGGAGGTGGSGGGAAAGGSGNAGACFEPDLACPAERPFIGSACATTEVCQFEDPNKVDTWTYECAAGLWKGEATCEPLLGGGCPVAPLVEKCNAPFDGSRTSASIEIGPAGPFPFRPFQDGEEAPLTWGGQGSPMISFRVRAAGADDVDCARIDTTTVVSGQPGSHASAIKLHCGETLTVFTVTDTPCDPGVHPIELKVDVRGLGKASVNLKITDPLCLG